MSTDLAADKVSGHGKPGNDHNDHRAEETDLEGPDLRPGTLRCGCRFIIVLRRSDHLADGVEAMNEHTATCPNRLVTPPAPPEPPDTPLVGAVRAVVENVFSAATGWIVLAIGAAITLVKYGDTIFS